MALFESVITPHIVHRLGWTLLHFVWQGTIVAIVLAILLRALRKSAANARYIICCSALVLIVGLPVVTIQLVSSPAGRPLVELEPGPTVAPTATPAEPPKELPVPEPVAVTETEKIESPAAASSMPLRERLVGALEPTLPYIVLSWLLGVLGLSVWHLGGWTQLQRLRRRMVQPVDRVLQSRVEAIAEQLGIGRSVEAMKSALVQVPTVIGWLRPVILLPASALTGLSVEQLEAILAHELAHIRRYDYLVNMLQTVVEILGFYHPAVWWVSHKIRLERENCCDDLAARMAGSERYAKALTLMEEIRGRQPELAVAVSGGSLFKRIQRLILPASAEHKDLSWVPAALAILFIIMLAVPTTLALSRRAAKASNIVDDGQVWGTAIEGVQCRLRTDGGKWQAGETPTLKADIRNLGTHKLHVVRHQGLCELWFDGRWYAWAGEIGAESSPLGPGREYSDITISLDEYWAAMRNGKPLRPRRRHIVRVAFITESEQGEVIRVHSNPVEIEILPGGGGGDSSADRARREAEARRAGLEGFRRRLSYIGLDLTDAPRSTSPAELADLFEERPAGSGSYVLGDDVVAARHPEFWEDGVVYYASKKKQFYIIEEPGHPGSGSKTFYGPFEGEPWNRFGMAEPRAAKKEYHLGIYLVVDPIVVGRQFGSDQPDEVATLEQLRLATKPLLTEEDIVEYDWNEHVLTLTGEAWKHLPAVRSVWGWPFVIVADGERCYLGAFWSVGSSYTPKVPFIGGFRPGWRENKIQISPPEPIAGAEDTRNDPRVQKVLEELGIARSAESPEAAEDSPAWGEVVDGLQLGLAFDGQERPYRQGELVSFKVYARNVGDEEVRLVYEDLAGASPGVRGTPEKPMILDGYFMGGSGGVEWSRVVLEAGEMKMLGKVQLQLEPLLGERQARHSGDLEAGEYPIRQTVKFGSFTEEESWRGQLTTGEMKLVVEELMFGPVIEQSLKGQGEPSSAIDFDRHRTLTPEMETRDGVDVASYPLCRKQGIDAIAQKERGGLAAISMEVAGLDEGEWDTMRPRELAKLLKDRNRRIKRVKERGYGIVQLSGDSVFGFKTRDGGIGMVRIVGLKEEPWGVKIRYKTAGGTAAERKAAIDVETLLAKMRQAQRPARNMRIEWVSESGPGTEYWGPRLPRKISLTRWTGSVVISGLRSRIEERQETYYGTEVNVPGNICDRTYVFDGSEQRNLEKTSTPYRGHAPRGDIRPTEYNSWYLIHRLFGSNPLLHGKEWLEEYKYKIELLESNADGICVLKVTGSDGDYDLITVDGNRGYNTVKREHIRPSYGGVDGEYNFKLKRYAGGRWFVSESEEIIHESEPLKRKGGVGEKMRVTDVQFDIPEPGEETFKLEFPRGTRVGFPGGEIVVGGDAEEELREVMESAEKLKGLGKALIIYANEDEKGRLADTLQQLLEGDCVSKEALEWLVENVEYFGQGKTAADAHDSPIAFDKTVLQRGKGTNVLYLDGHVAFEAPKELERLELGSGIKKRLESAERLRELHKALMVYHGDDEEGRLVDTLPPLHEADYVSKEALEWLVANVEYLGKGVSAADAPDTAIAYDKALLQKGEGTNVLFLDGHIVFKRSEQLKELGIRAAGE